MAVPKSIKELCPPAMLYFYISIIFFVIALMQNLGNNFNYSLGDFSCNVTNTTIVFIIKLMYILFWTYVLNLICKNGNSNLSWFLLLFHFILFFVLLGLIMIT
jgi:hypothetical protein